MSATVLTIERPPAARAWGRPERLRARQVSLAAAGGLVVALAWTLVVGDIAISPARVLAALTGGADADTRYVVNQLRVPRALTAAAVGAALGMSGALFQSLTRNPLGSPDIMGFDAGAALGAVAVIVTLDGSTAQVVLGAVVGGLCTALLIVVLSWRRGGLHTTRAVLMGVGVAATLGAVANHLLTTAKITDVQRATVWLTGSLNNRTWAQFGGAAVCLAVLAPAAVLLSGRLRLLALGDDAATGLGLRVGRAKVLLAVVGVGLAAGATAAAGPIGFVALVAPAIVRRVVRSGEPLLIPAALGGALLTVVADLFARRSMAWMFDRPVELPVGIVTAILGAPYLMWLLTRTTRESR